MNTVVKRSCLLLLLTSLLALPALAQDARVQFIHNSGDIDARPIDLYVGDSLYVDQFTFRTARPFLNVPSGNVKITLTHPTNPDSLVAEVDLTLTAGGTYVCVINGILEINLGKYDNPDPMNRNIQISVFAVPNARETASDPAKVEFFVNNGNTDGPLAGLDIFTVGSTTPLVDNLGYSQSTAGYFSVDPAIYTYDVKPGNDNATLIGSFEGDFTAAAGKSAVVLASGFVTPANNQGSQRLGLIAVFADGSVQTFRSLEVGPIGKWKFAGASPYKFTDFIGADTLVNQGHGIAVDRRNRIWIGNFTTGVSLRVIHPDGTQDPISPILTLNDGTTDITTDICRGMTLDNDGSILFARGNSGSGRIFRIDPNDGKALVVSAPTFSLLSPMVDKDGFVWTGSVANINPILVLDPSFLTETQRITLTSPPLFGRGLGITADARKIFTPDLGGSGGPLYIWTTTDFLNYNKTDSIFTNDQGELIMKTNRQTMNWHPQDSTLWVSVDRASTPVDNSANGLYVFDFKDLSYTIVSMPEIRSTTTGNIVGNGPRNVAFSVSGDTAYAVSFNGNRLMRFVKGATAVKDKPLSRIPGTYELFQNYPNPFNPNTTIAYSLSQFAIVELKVYDSLGRQVKTLVHKVMPPGRHEATFETEGLASGIYHYRLYVDGQVFTKSMMLLK
ncbi:DUF4397 domain-containing protein [candidate division KSB1 bacterium]|nr:DUF4397 domain-containing protein [candidate division KSB1 bacterium]